MMDVEMDVDRKQDKELLREGVHRVLVDEIISLTEEEVKLVIRLLASSRTG